jgi:hypothetical protein
MQYVLVIGENKKILMPGHPARAKELLNQCKAMRLFVHGLFYIQFPVFNQGFPTRSASI